MSSKIFLSYARDDDEPFVRKLHTDLAARRLDIWWDRVSLPNRALSFLNEIRDAINQCDRLLLVVGPDALQSDYVTAEWQHALEYCKPVYPVLRLGDYSALPEDLALLDTPDFRDDACYADSLAHLLRHLELEPARLGRLHGVPSRTERFLSRQVDMRAIKNLVLSDITSPTVLDFAERTTVLQGMAGVGKSVLAAAFAQSCETRRVFSDGLIWVTIGQNPDSISSRMQLAGVAFDDPAEHYNDQEKAARRLRKLLDDKTCLIILDDVWAVEPAEIFREVLGPRCRLLVTTRDRGIATSLNAREHRIDVLSESDALTLLASWVRQPAAALPPEAYVVAKRCGYLPLALALCGAMILDGHSWHSVIEDFEQADLSAIEKKLPNYEYPNVLRALKVSIDALQKDSQEAAESYAELAVFPTDEPIPEEAVVTLWKHTHQFDARKTQHILVTLARKALLRLEGQAPKRHVALHDLQHEYLRAVLENVSGLHDELLAAYRELCPGDWSTGPDDGYFFRHLATHLHGANHDDELTGLLQNSRWLQAKLNATDAKALLADYDLLHDYNQLFAEKGVPILAPLTETGSINALLLEDLLVNRLILVGAQRREQIAQICTRLLYGGGSSTSGQRTAMHAYQFGVTVANELALVDLLKRATTHPDPYIRDAVLYALYVNYEANPDLSKQIIRHVINNIWRGPLINFTALQTAITITLLIVLSYSEEQGGLTIRAELYDLWRPVIHRLPSGKRAASWFAGRFSRLILNLVYRIAMFRMLQRASETAKGLFNLADSDACLPIPEAAKPHLNSAIDHYLHAGRKPELRLEELHAHLEALFLNPDEKIRRNVLIGQIASNGISAWYRHDPIAASRVTSDLIAKAVAHKVDLMEKATPMVTTMLMVQMAMKMPDNADDAAFVLENFGRTMCLADTTWGCRIYGLRANYLLQGAIEYAHLYHAQYQTTVSPYLDQHFDWLVEQRDLDLLKRLLYGISREGLTNIHGSREETADTLFGLVNYALDALRRMKLPQIDEELTGLLVDVFVNLRYLDAPRTIRLLDNQSDGLITPLMKERINNARRSPQVGRLLATVFVWYGGITAVDDKDPVGREAFAQLYRCILQANSVADALIDFALYYLQSDAFH